MIKDSFLESLTSSYILYRSEEYALKILVYCKEHELYNLCTSLSSDFNVLFPNSYKITKLLSDVYYNIEDWNKSYELYSLLLEKYNSKLNEDDIKEYSKRCCECIPKIKDRYIHYDKSKVDYITSILRKKKEKYTIPTITFTITTCKRLDLFLKTINSFINCCEDIEKVDEWICIDDNSSEDDRNKMKELYPFFTFYFKKPEEKGHSISMNILLSMIKTPYIFHMEDDWQFFVKRSYISECFGILQLNDKYGQCLINKNYSEIPEDYTFIGGIKSVNDLGNVYYVHEHYSNNTEKDKYNAKYGNKGLNNGYWPHYSLRPSLLKTSVLREVGEYKNTVKFELDYAYRYTNKGYVSVFLQSFYCIHIGKITTNRNGHDANKLNAYNLNDTRQF